MRISIIIVILLLHQGLQAQVTFAVDSVKPNTKRKGEYTAKSVIEAEIHRKVFYMPKEDEQVKVVPCFLNPLITAVGDAFDEHRPLILSPDAIYCTILQGVAIHLNLHMDELKSKLIKSDAPDELIVRNDELDQDPAAWGVLIDQLTQEMKPHFVKDTYKFFNPQFSTTTASQMKVNQILMLNSFKTTFKYIAESGCGIPQITLTGELNDWLWIEKQLDELQDYGMGQWAEVLRPVIHEFIQAYKGKPNLEFWHNIYKSAMTYGEVYLSGWIIKFFPYLEGGSVDEEWLNDRMDADASDTSEVYWGLPIKIEYTPNPFMNGDDYLLSTIDGQELPAAFTHINVQWNNYFKGFSKNMLVYSGFIGLRQHDNLALEPFATWAVFDSLDKEDYYDLDYYEVEYNKLEHKEETWVPFVIKDPSMQQAFYNRRTYRNQEEGMKALKIDLERHVLQQFPYWTDSIDMSFVVLQNGKITRLNLNKLDQDNELKACIQSFLTHPQVDWFPGTVDAKALSDKEEMFMMLDVPNEELKNKAFKVNSILHVHLFSK